MDIAQGPDCMIAYGLDHKATLIAKASRLGLYENDCL